MSARERSLEERQAEHVVDRFIAAYNAKDVATIAALLGEDIHMVHREANVDIRGRSAVLAMLRRSAEGAFTDRRFHSERRRLIDGPVVAVEQMWGGTAAHDVPGMAAQGERVTMELCTLFTVEDGRIVDYTEYG